MNKKSFLLGVVVTAAFAFGVGALTEQQVGDVQVELSQRRFRDLNNQEMFKNSPTAFWYFQGRADAIADAMILIQGVNVPPMGVIPQDK